MDMRTKEGRESARPVDKKAVLDLMPKLFFVEDFGMGRYRVGRTDWPGDVFELVPRAEFDAFRRIYQKLNMPLLIVNDDDSMEPAPTLD